MTLPFDFRYGPRLHAGAGASADLAALLPPGRILLVSDRQIGALGLLAPVIAAIEASGRTVILFDEVEADPSRATLMAAVVSGAQAGVSAVVGFGGGSPMDVAKLAAYLLGSRERLDDLWGVDRARGQGLPLVMVPTTAGTGSEATGVAIISLPDGEKRAVASAALIAGDAILDPLLTLGLPRAVTAATGMDAIVHAIEAFTSLHRKNPLSDMLAREALTLLVGHIATACADPGDVAARSAMLLGAHLAGVAFANAPVGGVHALAYPLGGRFHVAHGVANVVMLPHVLAHNLAAATPLYAELAPLVDPALAGLPAPARAEGLVAALATLAAGIGLPRRLRDIGIGAADIAGLADDAMRQERLLRNNPTPISCEDATRIYGAAL
jgi:alcohol dehydrogenase class IV